MKTSMSNITLQTPQLSSQNLTRAQDVDKASKEFSSYVASTFLKQIIPKPNDSSIGQSNANDIFYDLLTDEYAKIITKQDNLNIIKTVEKDLYKNQEKNLGG